MESTYNNNSIANGLVNTCPQSSVTGTSAQLFLTLINALLLAQCKLTKRDKYPEDIGQLLRDNDTYDFIIIGAGSAGSVVANRLSENDKWKVLLLEAGTYPSSTSEIPAVFFSLQHTEEDWEYSTEPSDNYCLSMNNRTCYWPRGKALGGSSAINAMLYVRGNKKNHDDWAKMGNTGWDYESVLPYYIKSENVQDPLLQNSNIHGKGGYLTSTKYIVDYPIRDTYIRGIKELGYDFYSDQVECGFYDSLTTIEDGTRCSSSNAFLTKIKRNNLHLATGAFVKKIIIDPGTKIAKGVIVNVNGKELVINARKEVVLSGGAINSPQLLMLSGVGPAKQLQEKGIDLIKALPVGENLMDHIMNPFVLIEIPRELTSNSSLEGTIYEYFMHRKGSLSTISFTNFMGFLNTKNVDNNDPDIQIHHLLYETKEDHQLFLRSINVIDDVLETKYNYPLLLIVPTLIQPKSRGKLLLKTANPFDKPLIYPNYMSDENDEDMSTMLKSINFVTNLLNTTPFKRYNLKLFQSNIPNCNNYQFMCENYWRCVLRNLGATIYHPAGTCKMGPETDNTTVVNPRLQVHGIKGLRVMDASVMPIITSGNTNVPSIMIGEKGADLIKEDWY